MNRAVAGALLGLLAAGGLGAAPAWKLSWADEFNAPQGASIDREKWVFDLGGGGWGNNELQCYTDSTKNVRHDGKGNLVIEARKERVKDAKGNVREYSSGRILTKGRFAQAFGRFEARLKITQGKGLWPAFWLLGDDIDKVQWPQCGEIDIMENVGHELSTARGTVHGPGYSGGAGIGGHTELPYREALADQFHVYAVEWEPSEIRWYLDGKQYFKLTPTDLKGKQWVFDHPHFILLNLAVGGNWPGDPAPQTRFPARYLVDYIRVYQDANLRWDSGRLQEMRDKWAAESAALAEARKYKGDGWNRLPGRVEAEDFAHGGPDKAYRDLDEANQGGDYRQEGVDIQACQDGATGMNVGWTNAGEWIRYDVLSPGGRFNVKARVACAGEGGRMSLNLGGREMLAWQVPDTGGWQAWQSLDAGTLELPKGRFSLLLRMQTQGPRSASSGNLNWLDFEPAP